MLLKYQQLFEKKFDYGDMVVCIGDIDGLKTHNHIGFLRNSGIEFINRFSDKLHDLKGRLPNNRGWFAKNKKWFKKFDNNRSEDNVPLLYSDKFSDIVSYSLNFLLDYENNYYSDVSYIDVTPRNDTVSCLMADSIKRLEPNENPWKSTMRQNIRIGRFLKKVLDDPDPMIENYINEYKFSYKLDKSDIGRFKVAKGVEMAKWYLEMNYAPGGGSLNASCMRHIRSQRRLPLYTNNPNKVKMLYLLNPMGKLLGRTLIWKLDEPKGVIYMDKVYCTEDYIEKLFLDYAKRKGILTKGEVDEKNMYLRVNIGMDYGPPQMNPFMDSFKFFVKSGKYLTNRFRNLQAGDYWEYQDHD